MSQSISCPACNAALDLDPAQLGRWVNCSKCGFGFVAASDPRPGESSPVVEETYLGPDRSKMIGFVAISAVGLLVVSLLVVLIVLNRGNQSPTLTDKQAKAKSKAPGASSDDPRDWQKPPPGSSGSGASSSAAADSKSNSGPSEGTKQKSPPPPSNGGASTKDRDSPTVPEEPPRENRPPEGTNTAITEGGKIASKEGPPEKKSPPRPTGRRPDEIQNLAMRRINHHRAAAGLAEARWDEFLSDACRAHAKYLIQNRIDPGSGAGLHFENADLLGFSKEGVEAARASLIVGAAGRVPGGESNNLIDTWMASFYHRIPLLRPELKHIGYGYYASLNPSLWYVLVDHQSGAEEPSDPEKRKQPVLYPGPNQTRVPLRFAMGLLPEKPNPIPANGDSQRTGFPITATFFSGATVDEVKAVLRDQTQRDAEHWLSTPLEPARSDAPQHNTILLIPKAPLKRLVTYTVSLSAKVDGKPWQRSWSFTTAGR